MEREGTRDRTRNTGAALFAAAAFGGHLAYAPLLALLLPRRIVAIAPDHAAAVTSLVMLIGAIAASLAHIASGWISDRWRRRHGNRRVPIALGLALTVLALAMLGLAGSTGSLIAGLVAFQCALNLMLAPIGALLVDYFADSAKGRVAALTNLAIPLASLGTGATALAFPHDGAIPFAALAVVVGLSVAPIVAFWQFLRAADAPANAPAPRAWSATAQADLVRAGVARLLVQSGAAFVMTYFYLFLVHHPARAGLAAGQSVDLLYGRMVLATTLVVLVVTMLAGAGSDRRGRRRAPMIMAALAAAMGMALLVAGSGWGLLVGYGLFQTGLVAYLALDSALVAQVLRGSARPGEMLGYMNLANTLPSILVPLIVLGVSAPGFAAAADALWGPGFAAAAGCCVLAAVLVARIRTVA